MAQKKKPDFETEAVRPNFVFIMTDDQSFDAFSLYDRFPFLKTPNLDKLALESAIFENAFVTISLCSPSRACIMTGTHAHINGVRINEGNDPDPSLPTLAGVLQQNGYETAFVGKWHMATHARPRPGFDYWLSFKGQGQYFDPPLNENGRDFKAKGYITDILTDYAIKWIQKPRKKPFCLFLWHKAIHAPFAPAPRHKDLYPDAKLAVAKNWDDTYEGKPAWLRRNITYGAKKKEWNASEGKRIPEKIELKEFGNKRYTKVMKYLRTISAVDESTARIQKHLKKTGISDDTMLVFTSDNGYLTGSHQGPSDKRVMYEESLRIPLFIKYPKLIKPGSKIKQMALNIDIAPTFLELAGAPIPDTMQGRSLVPLLKGQTRNWRKSFMYEYFQEDFAPGIVTMVGVRTERYKYIHYPELKDDIDELYDLKKDPIEMKNLINDPKYTRILKDLKKELDRLIKKTGYN